MNTSVSQGLREDEAKRLLAQYGPNVLAEHPTPSLFRRYLEKLGNPLILLLLVAAFLSAALSQTSDFIIICVITLVSITLDVFQESTAQNAAERLRKRVSLTATVLRDGVKKEVSLSTIVPGDVIFLSIGDIVPADGKLIASRDLLIDESTLTGESFPKEKLEDSPVRMGTNVIAGEGQAIISETGKRTQLGNIAGHLVVPRPKTEFEKGISEFGILLMRTAIVLGVFVFLAHILLAHEFFSSVLFVLALVVGFAPELLPMIITINLSRGAIRMSKKGVIVKYLPSIENFGSMDILATDKTGTLTENRITLEKYEDLEGNSSEKVLQYGYIGSLFQSGFKGPMEEAILAHKEAAPVGFSRVDVIPFDFFRKRVSVVVEKNRERMVITKGAPEEIGKICQSRSRIQKNISERMSAYGKKGFRVLAVAYKNIPIKKSYNAEDETDETFLGFMAFLDPPKKTVTEALKRLKVHDVDIKILTGDSDVVTATICQKIGLPVSGILNGEDIERLSSQKLQEAAETTTIFCRLNPNQKVRVIRALRGSGHVVGYMGDGINDAPSLREADIGLSVNNATDVAKLSADIILLHKDLHVLLDGVRVGRETFANVMKYLKMNISSGFGNMVSLAVASMTLPFLPMLPVQVLLNDLLYDTSQLTLASDRVEDAYLSRPRRWKIEDIRKFMVIFGPVSSLFDLVTFGILLWIFHANVKLFQTGWFLESIVTQTLIIFSIRTRVVPFFHNRPSRLFALSLFTVIAFALLLPYTPLAIYFSFIAPPVIFFAMLAGIVVAYTLLVEVLKKWFYRTIDV